MVTPTVVLLALALPTAGVRLLPAGDSLRLYSAACCARPVRAYSRARFRTQQPHRVCIDAQCTAATVARALALARRVVAHFLNLNELKLLELMS